MKKNEIMKGNCVVCNAEIEIQMCCSGRDCGCMGLPVDPPVCSNGDCYDEFFNLLKQSEDISLDDLPYVKINNIEK